VLGEVKTELNAGTLHPGITHALDAIAAVLSTKRCCKPVSSEARGGVI